MSKIEEFNAYRSRMNERMLSADSKIIKRVFNLDTNTYQAGALDVKTKELMGLTSSLSLRCEDCIRYHISSAIEAGASEREIIECFEVCLVVGGTIMIPELRRAFEFLDEVLKAKVSQ